MKRLALLLLLAGCCADHDDYHYKITDDVTSLECPSHSSNGMYCNFIKITPSKLSVPTGNTIVAIEKTTTDSIAEFEAAAAEFNANVDAIIENWKRIDAARDALIAEYSNVSVRGCSTGRLKHHDRKRVNISESYSGLDDRPEAAEERCRIVRIDKNIYREEAPDEQIGGFVSGKSRPEFPPGYPKRYYCMGDTKGLCVER